MTIDTGASVTIARPDVAAGWPAGTPSRRYMLQTASVEEGSLSGTDIGTELHTHLGVCRRNLGRVHSGTRYPTRLRYIPGLRTQLAATQRGINFAMEPPGGAPVVPSYGQRPCGTSTMRAR